VALLLQERQARWGKRTGKMMATVTVVGALLLPTTDQVDCHLVPQQELLPLGPVHIMLINGETATVHTTPIHPKAATAITTPKTTNKTHKGDWLQIFHKNHTTDTIRL
jgi:hypothetical protein